MNDTVTRYIWIVYGIAQATVTMLMAFDVIDGTTLTESLTAIALVAYVAANELLVKRGRWSRRLNGNGNHAERTDAGASVPSVGTTEGGTAD